MAPYLIIILILIGLLGFNNPIPITILVVIFGILPIAKSGPTKLSHIDLQSFIKWILSKSTMPPLTL